MSAQSKDLTLQQSQGTKSIISAPYHVYLLYYLHTTHMLNIGCPKYQKASRNTAAISPNSIVNHLCYGMPYVMLTVV